MGPKDLRTPAHFISSPRPMPRRKKCPRSNEGNPDYQDILPDRPRQTKITEGEGASSPEAVPLRIPKEIPSPMGQP